MSEVEVFYKIGELARLSSLSQRTIDYYTNIGLIRPEKRSDKNYRLYSSETLARLKRIEMLKKEKYTLEEIKQSLDKWNKVKADEHVTEKMASLSMHLHQLEKEVKELKPILENLKPSQARNAFKLLSPQTAACVEALLLLLDRGQLM